jgi:Esterase/lipase
MMAALKALSYPDIDVKKNYKIDRAINNLSKPKIKILYKMWDHRIVLGDHVIPVRIFMPREQLGPELLVFFHGGGWVSGNIDTYIKPCGNLANHVGRRVISVDYRLAPEFPFPHAVNDCYHAVKELFKFCDIFDVSPDDVVLIGDSAGGNLAAVVSLMARDKGEFKIGRQILIYPAVYNNHTETSPFESVRTNGYEYLLTSKKICDYMELYIQDKKYLNNPYFAPLLADDLSNQPKTLIITAEFDPLRDEGEEYGRQLRLAGGDVTIYRMMNGLHGFFSLPARFSHVKKSYKLIQSFLGEVTYIEDGVE